MNNNNGNELPKMGVSIDNDVQNKYGLPPMNTFTNFNEDNNNQSNNQNVSVFDLMDQFEQVGNNPNNSVPKNPVSQVEMANGIAVDNKQNVGSSNQVQNFNQTIQQRVNLQPEQVSNNPNIGVINKVPQSENIYQNEVNASNFVQNNQPLQQAIEQNSKESVAENYNNVYDDKVSNIFNQPLPIDSSIVQTQPGLNSDIGINVNNSSNSGNYSLNDINSNLNNINGSNFNEAQNLNQINNIGTNQNTNSVYSNSLNIPPQEILAPNLNRSTNLNQNVQQTFQNQNVNLAKNNLSENQNINMYNSVPENNSLNNIQTDNVKTIETIPVNDINEGALMTSSPILNNDDINKGQMNQVQNPDLNSKEEVLQVNNSNSKKNKKKKNRKLLFIILLSVTILAVVAVLIICYLKFMKKDKLVCDLQDYGNEQFILEESLIVNFKGSQMTDATITQNLTFDESYLESKQNYLEELKNQFEGLGFDVSYSEFDNGFEIIMTFDKEQLENWYGDSLKNSSKAEMLKEMTKAGYTCK